MTRGGDNSETASQGEDSNNSLDEVKNVALNGAQVTALIGVITSYKEGVLSKEQAINIIMISFGLDNKDATSMIEGDEELNE